MPSIMLDCPHCSAENVGFNIQAEYKTAVTPSGTASKYVTLAKRTKCEKGVITEYVNRGSAQAGTPLSCQADPCTLQWDQVAQYPGAVPTRVPGHTSEQIKRFFTQAANASKRGDWDASGAMSRKVVDVSTQQMLGSESTKYGNIRGRIDALADKGAITSDLKDWAHQVRLGGNEAAHDEHPYSEAEANELLDFADLYLTYVYTLPGRLKDRRARAEAEKKNAE